MTKDQLTQLLDARYPIHLKARPELGIKKDCPLQREMKQLARKGLMERILQDEKDGLTFEQIAEKHAHYQRPIHPKSRDHQTQA